MTLIVETGAGLANSNTYLSQVDYEASIAGTPDEETWANLEDEQKEAFLKFATAYLDSNFRFYGKALTADQALKWPRTKNFDHNGNILAPGTIPKVLKTATAFLTTTFVNNPELALAEAQSLQTISSFTLSQLTVNYAKQAGVGGSENRSSQKDDTPKSLRDWRIPELEANLRAIGTPVTEDWIFKDRRTEIR